MALDFVTAEEAIRAARRRLHQGAWDYLVGGSESETTFRRNRMAFDKVAFRPKVLVDVTELDPSTTLLGHKLRIPVLLAPIGSLQEFTPEGAVAASQAAGEFGIVHVVSSGTQPALEETAACSPSPKIFQLYIRGDWAWVQDMVARIKASGYKALTITVDTAVISRRERPMLTRWMQPTRRVGWDNRHSASVTWDTLDKIKAEWGGPMLLKGIARPDDAARAVQHGIDVVWVSNHGGRQLDHGLGALDTLPEIVQAVAGKAQIMVDGGVNRGSDVLKAIALGANAVAVGRLQGYGLAAGGKEGLLKVLEILEAEIHSAMGLLGVTKLADLTSDFVCKADPVAPSHEMSAWPNMPEVRIR